MPTGIMSAGGRVFAAIAVLDERIEEGVDDIENTEEFVGEEDDGVFVIGNGIDDGDEIGMEREALG